MRRLVFVVGLAVLGLATDAGALLCDTNGASCSLGTLFFSYSLNWGVGCYASNSGPLQGVAGYPRQFTLDQVTGSCGDSWTLEIGPNNSPVPVANSKIDNACGGTSIIGGCTQDNGG